MINFRRIQIDNLVEFLRESYRQNYGMLDPQYPDICAWVACMALENISKSNALYHNVEHTTLVTMVGQEIIKGKHLQEGGVTPKDWFDFTVALLCHDIGYVHGLCKNDTITSFDSGTGEQIPLKRGASDAPKKDGR